MFTNQTQSSQLRCRPRAKLEQFLSGEIGSDAELSSIHDHLEQCSECLDLLEGLTLEPDPLMLALRQPTQHSTYFDEVGCRLAIQRVAGIGSTDNDSAPSTNSETNDPDSESDSAPPCYSLIGKTIGPYELLEQVGAGGMGVLFRARHTRLQRDVAVKLLPTERTGNAAHQRRFEREMEAVGRLAHPHIVAAYDAGDADGHHFLVMEMLDGVDLATLTTRFTRLKISDACEVIRQAAIGLQYVHEQGIVHRDIKPSNLMLVVSDHAATDGSSAAVVKVLDLGLARFDEPESADSSVTAAGQLIGTVDYMAPEQFLGGHDIDIRSDIYSLGATLFQLLTGQPTWAGQQYESKLQKLQGLLIDPIPSVRSLRPEVPEALAAVVQRMLERDRHHRYATPREVAVALEPFTPGHDLTRLLHETQASNASAIADDTARPQIATQENAALPAPAAQPKRRTHLWPVLLLVFVPSLLILATIFWLKTDGGYVRIDTEPSIDVTVEMLKDGRKVRELQVGRTADQQLWYRTGNYELRLPAEARDRFVIRGNTFTLRRGRKAVVTISRVAEADGPSPIEIEQEVSPLPPTTTGGLLVTSVSDRGPGSLRQAIEAAEPDDTIRFDKSLAGQTIVLTTGELVINKNLSIDASDLSSHVTIDAGGLSRVLRCEAGHRVSLNDLTISGGHAIECGGGIHNDADLTLTGVRIEENVAVDSGAAICNSRVGRLAMIACQVTRNRAANAALYLFGEYSIQNCTISVNTASTGRSAIEQGGGTGLIVNTTIASNTSTGGACLLVGVGGNTVLRHVTIADNLPLKFNTGYAVTVDTGAQMVLENCVVAGNGFPKPCDLEAGLDAVLNTRGANMIGTFRSRYGHALDASVMVGSQTDFLDPGLARLDDYGGPVPTMPPLTDSPVVDAAQVTDRSPRVDARGRPRSVDGRDRGDSRPDLGAAEFDPQRDTELVRFVPKAASAAADVVDLNRPAYLRVQHLFVRNEGDTETLQRSKCQIIPFATYSPLAADSAERREAQAEWERIQASAPGLVPPAWIQDPRRVPLTSVASVQKAQPIECPEGNNWTSMKYEDSVCTIAVHDDPRTEDVNEVLEVGFLVISHFQLEQHQAYHYDFKTLAELQGQEANSLADRDQPGSLYTASVRPSPLRRNYGLQLGAAFFRHYLEFDFVDTVTEDGTR